MKVRHVLWLAIALPAFCVVQILLQYLAAQVLLSDLSRKIQDPAFVQEVFDLPSPPSSANYVVLDGKTLKDNELERWVDAYGSPVRSNVPIRAYLRVEKTVGGRQKAVWYQTTLKLCGEFICPYEAQDLVEIAEPTDVELRNNRLERYLYVRKLGFRFRVGYVLYMYEDGAVSSVSAYVTSFALNPLDRFLRPAIGAVAPDYGINVGDVGLSHYAKSCRISAGIMGERECGDL